MNRVYLSGPISGLDREVAMSNFSRAATTLKKWSGEFDHGDWEVVNPFSVAPACGIPVPSFSESAFSRELMSAGHSWSCWIRGDLIAMLGCTHIYMLDGWEQSHGARLEHFVAVSAGLRVLQLDNYEKWEMKSNG